MESLENTILELLCKQAAQPRLDPHVNVFEQGVTSLHILTVAAQLQELLRREVQPLDFFKFPTVAAFAATLVDVGATPGSAGAQLASRSGRGARRREVAQARSKTP